MTYVDALNAAFDELDATNELRAWCDAHIAEQQVPQLEELATALSGALDE
jgi:hypothetical protein